MWRPRLPRRGSPDFWPVVIALIGAPAVVALLSGEPLVPTLLIAGAAVFLWHAMVSWRR